MRGRERVRDSVADIKNLAMLAHTHFNNDNTAVGFAFLRRIGAECDTLITLLTPPAPERKRVLHQCTLDGELVATHKNCADASRAIDGRATRQDISLAARGKAHAAGGYRWQW